MPEASRTCRDPRKAMAAEADELRLHGLNAILAVHARRPGAIR